MMSPSGLEVVLQNWAQATAPVATSAELESITKPLAITSGPRAPGGCRPCRLSDFRARVATFRVATWFAKPTAINAFRCAQHGWTNSKQDQLLCQCCSKLLCFRIDPALSAQGIERIGNAYAQLLVKGHADECPWRGNPSPDSFARLPIASAPQVLEAWTDRLERALELVQNNAVLLKCLETLRLDTQALATVLGDSDHEMLAHGIRSRLESTEHAKEQVPSKELVVLACLSACGWQLKPQDNAVLSCETCTRQLWLWTFTDKISSDTDAENAEENRPAKRHKHENVFDPRAEHRDFCPWVRSQDAVVERTEDAALLDDTSTDWSFNRLPGWQQCAQALKALMVPTPTLVSSRTVKSSRLTPELALESVRSVLGIHDL